MVFKAGDDCDRCGLHTIRLGPPNHIWCNLGKHINLTPFEVLHGLVKTDRQKKQFQGPQVVKLLNNLHYLRQYLPPHLHPFVNALEKVKCVYTIAHARSVVKNHREVISEFGDSWLVLMQNFQVTMKVHIILHHLSDYMEITGKTLCHANDQVGEAVHHSVKQFIECHPNYNHTDKSTEEYGEDILTGIKHFNANNIGSIW